MSLTVVLEERWQTLQEGQRDIRQRNVRLAGVAASRRTRHQRGIHLPLRRGVRLPLRSRVCQRDAHLAVVGERGGGQREEQQGNGKATAYFFHGLLLFGKVKAQRDVGTLHRAGSPGFSCAT